MTQLHPPVISRLCIRQRLTSNQKRGKAMFTRSWITVSLLKQRNQTAQIKGHSKHTALRPERSVLFGLMHIPINHHFSKTGKHNQPTKYIEIKTLN